ITITQRHRLGFKSGVRVLNVMIKNSCDSRDVGDGTGKYVHWILVSVDYGNIIINEFGLCYNLFNFIFLVFTKILFKF
ncbi:hypothetical protein P0Y67_21810, partial [Photobacterium sp. SP02]|uniref:hypothetical protein n=1 Tax=Photobacterium sp. SP02 TaxID=3032280 RepID=UPI00314510B0